MNDRRSPLALWPLGALFTVMSCADGVDVPSDDARAYYDLVAEVPYAEVRHETRDIDFGTPAARGHLSTGWSSLDEVGLYDTETTFVWSDGPSSSIAFYVNRPREVAATLRAAPFVAPLNVTISINGHRSATLEMAAGTATYAFTVPRSALSAGANRLELDYEATVVPSRVSASSDDRELALGVDWLRFEVPDTESMNIRAEAEGRALDLPLGLGVEYYLRARPESFLSFEGVEIPDDGSTLEIELRHHLSDTSVLLATLGASTPARDIPLPEGPSPITRLAFRAVPGNDAAREGSVVLKHPTVRSSRGAPPPEPEPSPIPTAAAAARPNVVIYLIDALRADRLGCYGNGNENRESPSPNIDAFAREATLYENAFAQSAWTRAAVASLFTGRCPRYHGVQTRSDALSPDAVTLAEVLASNGYETVAFTTNVNAGEAFGFDQGFEDFTYLPPPLLEMDSATSQQVNAAVFSWLENRPGDAPPFFLYAHTTDPHGPYTPELLPETRSLQTYDAEAVGSLEWLRQLHASAIEVDARALERMQSLYDEEIRFNDHSFGELVSRLKALDLYDDTLIVLLSDHGEEFSDHGGWEHGRSLHNEQIHIPLLVKFPGQRPDEATRVASPAQQLDVAPTVLERARIAPPLLEGMPLRASERPSLPIFSQLGLDGIYQESVVDWPFKILRGNSGEGEDEAPWLELYQIEEDAREQEDVAAEFPVLAGFFYAVTKTHRHPDALSSVSVEVDETTLQRLKALGYVR